MTSTTCNHRTFLAASAIVAVTPLDMTLAGDEPVIQVFKSPICGYCSMWVDHLTQAVAEQGSSFGSWCRRSE